MLLGKRQRPQIKRTTSLSEIKFDLNIPSEPEEPSDHHQTQMLSPTKSKLVTVVEHRQVHHGLLDQRLLAMVSPRGTTQRRHSATQAEEDFLRSCSLCKRHLVPSRDIYMYRGDRAFCSLECRQQQITVDEKREKSTVRSTVVVAAGSGKGERVTAAVLLSCVPSKLSKDKGGNNSCEGMVEHRIHSSSGFGIYKTFNLYNQITQ